MFALYRSWLATTSHFQQLLFFLTRLACDQQCPSQVFESRYPTSPACVLQHEIKRTRPLENVKGYVIDVDALHPERLASEHCPNLLADLLNVVPNAILVEDG